MFALADANNFYVSCERAFNPKLRDRPVLVLSNNDGCVVSRSAEVKALGIPMGAPFFKVKHLIDRHDVQVFSSNYALYGDMSHRVMTALAQFFPEVEIYSIDEAFLQVSDAGDRGWGNCGQIAQKKILQWTGIPISLGMAKTKVLAKIATRMAKKSPGLPGFCQLVTNAEIEAVLSSTNVADVWGIGKKHAAWLQGCGITSALQFRDANEGIIRKKMGIVGVRLQLELQGTSCLPLELYPPAKQETCVSRSFGRAITSREELREAIALYTSRVAEKLRHQRQAATRLQIFARTSIYDENPYSNAVTLSLPTATNTTPELLHYAMRGIERIFQPGYRYKKAGAIAMGLVPEGIVQEDLFSPPKNRERDRDLMKVMDAINCQFGRGTVGYAATGIARPWDMKREKRSASFTTRWDEIPTALAR